MPKAGLTWCGLHRVITALAIMLATTAIAACTGDGVSGPLTATTQVTPDRVSVVRLPGGVSASIPKGGARSAGSLIATLIPRPAPVPDGLLQAAAVYQFAVTGTHLAGPVTITLPAPSDPAGPAAAILGYYRASHTSAGQNSASQTSTDGWTLVPSVYNPQARSVSGRVNIAALPGSAWAVIQLDSGVARNQIQDQLLDDLGIAGQSPPSCPAENGTSKNVEAPVEWCSGAAGGHAVLRVTNNRHYAIAAAYPAAWTAGRLRPLDAVTRQAVTVAGAVDAVPAGLREIILPGGQSVEFDPAAVPRAAIPPGGSAASGPVTLRPNDSGHMVTAIRFAVAAFSAAYGDVPGTPRADPARSARAVSMAFARPACHPAASGTTGFASLAADVKLALSCLRPAWQEVYGGPATLRPFLAGIAGWTAAASSQLLSGLQLLAESMISWPPVVVHLA